MREAYISENHVQLVRMWKGMTAETQSKPYICVSDPCILSFHDMVPPPSQLIFRYIDVTGDCGIMQFSGRDWIMSEHRKKTAIFHGGAGCGKSPVAKAYAAAVAQLYPTKNEEQYFYMISATEALPRDDLKTGIPILFDEFNPTLPRGCNPPHTIDEIKILTDVEEGGTIHGKGSNTKTTGALHFDKFVPRLITCNASSPHAFHPLIPLNIWDMTNDDRKTLCNDALAILKRCAFCHVQADMVPSSVKVAYKKAHNAEALDRFGEIFSGGNAIP